MTIYCPKSIKGLALRTTRHDDCGTALGEEVANARAVVAAFASVKFTPDIQAGVEIAVPNAGGDICIHDIDRPRVKGWNVELKMCGFVMPVLEMLVGVAALRGRAGTSGDIHGGVVPSMNGGSQDQAGIEVWSKNADPAQCAGGAALYMQNAITNTKNWHISGDFTYDNANPVDVTLMGYAQDNPNWQPSVEAEWNASDVPIIQAGGPVAWQAVPDVPATFDCAYLPVAS